jgi:hypothetical protein
LDVVKCKRNSRKLVIDIVVDTDCFFSISYPSIDVPMASGVRKDLLIRIFKTMMIDVWKGVYENLKAHFSEYPKKRVFKNLY